MIQTRPLSSDSRALSLFKLPTYVGKQLDGLMRRVLWKGSGEREGRGLAIVSWDMVCRPFKLEGLRFLVVTSMNLALIKRWVSRIISPKEDWVMRILKDNYGAWMDWER